MMEIVNQNVHIVCFALFLSVEIPVDIAAALRNVSNPIPVTETMNTLKPVVIVSQRENDREADGTLLSARDGVRRVIENHHHKSLHTDLDGKAKYTPLQRAFQRKSSNKVSRIAGINQAISFALKLCSECINIVRFGDGLFLKETADDEQIGRLVAFRGHIQTLIEREIMKAPKYGNEKRPLLTIEKSAVRASEALYDYVDKTIEALFDIQPVVTSDKSTENTGAFLSINQIKTK